MKKIFLLSTVFLYFLNLCYGQAGKLDSSFGSNGIVKTDFGSGRVIYRSTSIQTDGKIVAAGYTSNGTNVDFALVRYNMDGSLDQSFSDDGKQITDIGGIDNFAFSMAIQKDGKIVLAGSALVRYNTDGSLDKTFSEDGIQTTEFNIASIAIQSDGKIIGAGSSNGDFALARYSPDGSLDNSFSDDGKLATDFEYFDDVAKSVTIQSDGKIVVAGFSEGDFSFNFSIARYNEDGSMDNSFSLDGRQKTLFEGADYRANSVAIQSDGKILVAGGGGDYETTRDQFILARFKTDGSVDSTFGNDGFQRTRLAPFSRTRSVSANSLIILSDGKIVVGGYTYDIDYNFALLRYNNNGSLDNDFGNAGIQITNASLGDDGIQSIAIANNKLYAAGYGQYPNDLGVVARYLLYNESTPPTVNLTIPYNIVKYTAPARIKLNAAKINNNDSLIKVQFYNGTTLLHTADVSPYGFLWVDVPVGNYTLTAKATDSSGNVTTSNSIKVSVVNENVAPVVSIISPVDDATYTGPATIRIIANAKDPNDRISKVELYAFNTATRSKTLLRTEYYYPYTYTWSNVQPGIYLIEAIATDDKGLSTASESVTVTVTAPMAPIVSNRSASVNNQTDLNGVLSLRLTPNPTSNTLQIFTKGLQLNKPSTLSVVSASGIVMKTINVNTSKQTVQLDVSSLASGVYTLKVISGGKAMYQQFVKL